MAGDAVVSALLCLNVYDAIMARLLFDATEFKSFWCSTMQSYQTLSTKAYLFYAFCDNTFVRFLVFLSTSFREQVSELFEPLELFSHGSEYSCVKV